MKSLVGRGAGSGRATPLARLLPAAGLAVVMWAAPLSEAARATENPSDLRREIEALKQRQNSPERELREMKALGHAVT